MRRVLLIVLAALALVAAAAYAFRIELTERAIRTALDRNLSSDLVQDLPDGLHVALCGAGSPLPDPRRSGPCAAVIAGERVFVVDAGAGSSRVMSLMRIPQGRIEAVLLTHFHSDHIDGLGELLMQRWVNGAHTSPTPVYGPRGVAQVVDGFNRAYAQDRQYRVDHHGADIVPPSGHGGTARPFRQPANGKGEVLLDDGEVKITAFRVDHSPIDPAVGYRFDYKDRSVVLSGDTVKSDNLLLFADDVDLLVHEALAPNLVRLITEATAAAGRDNLAKITADILDYHASPVDAAELAQAAGAGHLLYYHIVPPLRFGAMEEMFLAGVDDVYEGPLTVGRDGTLVVMPAGSDVIEVRELL